MSVKNVNTSEKNIAKLDILIEKPAFDAAVLAVYKRMVGKITVPGFRKGKAPKGIIEKHYGKGIFYEDALNDLLPETLANAVTESGIEVVSAPEIEVGDINDEGVSLQVKYYTKPVMELKQYVGLAAEKIVREVTEAEINEDIERTRKRNARTLEVTDRPAQKDDTVVIDYAGSVDGKLFDGGSAEGHHLKLGSGQFIPGFEDQIIGHSVGDSFDVNVTFPAEYHAEELKGKAAVFAVTLHKIEFEELPALDDEFAKDVSEFDTLDAYKADIKEKIAKRNEQAASAQVEDQLMKALVENLEGDIPTCMFDNEVDNMLRDYEQRMQAQGIDMKMYYKYTGTDESMLRGEFKERAENQVKVRLALEKVVELENIAASAEEIEEEIKKIAGAYGMEVSVVKEQISEELLGKDIAVRKAIDFVKEKAVVTEKAESAAPAKKPRAPRKPKAEAEGAEEGAKPAKTTKAAGAAKTTKTTKTAKADEAADGAEKPVKKAAPRKKKTDTPAE